MTTTNNPPLRQGDVMLLPVSSMPKGLRRIEPGPRGTVLALGESSGHAHRFAPGAAVALFRPDDAGSGGWLVVDEPAALLHEEHTPIDVPPGIYRLPVQVERTPEAVRRVED